MKRKHDEGYALVFALVVLLFLSIVAMFMMQLTGRDLNAQVASIDRMKAQYAAQGRIEKIVGALENNSTESSLADIFLQVLPESNIQFQNTVSDSTSVTVDMSVPSEDQSIVINCSIKLRGRFTGNGPNDIKLNGSCSVDYLSYEITSGGGGN